MFKRLRDRIAEEGLKFPVGQDTENKSGVTNSNEDLITLSDSSSVVVPHSSSHQFSIGEDEDGSFSEQSTPQKVQNDASSSERPTPLRDQAISDVNFIPQYHPSKSSYVLQSDIESEREEPPTLNLDGISKDQLLSAIQTLKARSYKYKNKYAEVIKNFKELRDEKVKIENTLIENQDKSLRRLAELREQCQLEQKAKAHLEANLRLLLEEKDSRISVLETQINLLKEGGKSGSTRTLSDDGDTLSLDASSGDGKSDNGAQDIPALQEKVERLQHQHNQDKKTITAQKDQVSLLRKQNESLSQELEDKINRLNQLEDVQEKLKSEHESVLQSMQIRLEELEKQQEESIMSMAETKRNMHEELELKEKQLVKMEEDMRHYQSIAEKEEDTVTELKKNHDEKVNELQRQLDSLEKALEDEKQNVMQELKRGKTATINLMQQECSKKVAAIEEEWKLKFQELEKEISHSQPQELNETKDRLKQVEELLEQRNAAIAELEKENLSLKNSIEKLESEENMKEKLQITEKNKRDEISRLEEEMRKVLQEKEKDECMMRSQMESIKKEHEMKLQQERELIMLQAQERVSSTEAKCRDEIIALRDKLQLESKEVEKLKSELALLSRQLDESLLVAEANQAAAEKKNFELRDRLTRAEQRDSDRVERLKAEKEELNEKLKRMQLQVKAVNELESKNRGIANELETLQAEKEELNKKLIHMVKTVSELESKNQAVVTELETLRAENSGLQARVEALEASSRGECDAALRAKEEEMQVKLKQLVKDFCIQMDVKDKDCDQMISEMIEKSQELEDRLQKQHQLDISALRQDLFEKDCALDEMRDHYEETLQVKDKQIKELEMSAKSQKATGVPLLDSSHAAEGSDWDDTWAVPDENLIENSSPMHDSKSCEEHMQQIESLQDEVSKCNSEIKELKILLRLSPPDSLVNNNNRRDSTQSIPEPTEFEYLKNIIYEYMMGKEPVTLAKVIAAVLRFSDLQTQQVIRREETRQHTR